MSEAVRHERTRAEAPRTSILLVGASSFRSDLQTHLSEPVIAVDTAFQAIAELTIGRHRPPIRTVLVCSRADGSDRQRIGEQLRAIDPSIRLLLYASDIDADLRPSLALVYDDCLFHSASASRLAVFVRGDVARTADSDEPAATDGASVPTAATGLDRPQSGVECSVDPAGSNGELGDLDLVESILAGTDRPSGSHELADLVIDPAERIPSRLVAIALRLIRQQTGWDDLQFIDAEGEDHRSDVGIDVRRGEQFFGSLWTERVDRDHVKPWAVWLATWLELELVHRQQQRLMFTDELTGAGNRRFYNEFLPFALARARELRRPMTLLLFDIDDFKHYNDRYGHDAGDEILRESVQLLTSVIRHGDRVCRIGGDEFAVVFADLTEPRELGSRHPQAIEDIARRFQNQISETRFAKLGAEAPGSLTISGGLATFPWDALDVDDLMRLADERLLNSKARGKNVITFGSESTTGEGNQDDIGVPSSPAEPS